MPRLCLVLGGDRDPGELLADLAPLHEAWTRSGWVVDTRPGRPAPGPEGLTELARDSDALLVVGPRARSPRRMLPGPVLAVDGRPVPVGWLPDTGAVGVRRFAAAAAAVHGRPGAGRTLAVLGQRHPRYDALATRVARLAGEQPGLAVTRMTAYELHRDDLVRALALGPAAAVYLGHGRPAGWSGYTGIRAQHVGTPAVPDWRPASVVLSLTCHVASRHRVGLSFAENLVTSGAAAAAVAAIGPTLHTANARWALRTCHALATAATVGDLVAAVAPHDPQADAYRLIGDPTAPLADDPAWAVPSLEVVA